MTEWVCALVTTFADGGIGGKLILRGSQDECAAVQSELASSLVVKDKGAVKAQLYVIPAKNWERVRTGQPLTLPESP